MSRLSPKKKKSKKLTSKGNKNTARLDPMRKLDSSEHKDIEINTDSLYSFHYEEGEFINYLNKGLEKEFENYFYDFSSNPHKVNLYSYKDETENIMNNLEEILKQKYSLSDEDISFMIKARWIYDNQTTSLRLFFNLNDNNKYELLLIDPLHLAITSKIQREELTYKSNCSNTLCISSIFKNIQVSYPMTNNILKDIVI